MRSAESTRGALDARIRPLSGKRVLLAEDDETTRMILASVLEGMGLDVTQTRDGGRLLVAVASHYKSGRTPEDLDLIVTDIHMPVVSGIELFKGLRAAGWTTPVIMVTGDASREARDAADRLDAVLLLKPLDLDQFEAAVRTALERPRRRGLSRATRR